MIERVEAAVRRVIPERHKALRNSLEKLLATSSPSSAKARLEDALRGSSDLATETLLRRTKIYRPPGVASATPVGPSDVYTMKERM